VEIGITEAVQKHFSRQVHPRPPVSQRRLDLEHARPRWLRECLAEATGVFFYVFPGIAAVASFTVATATPLELAVGAAAFGGLFQIGWAFGIGIAFAIVMWVTIVLLETDTELTRP
jgi:apolipoprotein N-acyltransferase